MKKVFLDRNYNIVKTHSEQDVYSDELDEKIDLVCAAISKGLLSKEEGAELLKVVLSMEMGKAMQVLSQEAFRPQKKKNLFLFLLNRLSSVEKYAW